MSIRIGYALPQRVAKIWVAGLPGKERFVFDRAMQPVWKSKQAGIEARFIELAGYVNGQMPHFVVEKVQNALNDRSRQ